MYAWPYFRTDQNPFSTPYQIRRGVIRTRLRLAEKDFYSVPDWSVPDLVIHLKKGFRNNGANKAHFDSPLGKVLRIKDCKTVEVD